MHTRVILLILIHIFTACRFDKQPVAAEASPSYPRLEISERNARFFHLYDGRKQITMYLQFANYSGYHAEVYAVNGWMADENNTLPICGIYETERLTVYQFDNTTSCENLLAFSDDFTSLWEVLGHYRYLDDYQQKFVFTDEYAYRYHGEDSTEINLVNPYKRAILQQVEWLHLSPERQIDLRTYFDIGNDTLAITEARDHYLKIYFSQPSSNYGMGRCGAGRETGYLHIYLDQHGNPQHITQELIESCWEEK